MRPWDSFPVRGDVDLLWVMKPLKAHMTFWCDGNKGRQKQEGKPQNRSEKDVKGEEGGGRQAQWLEDRNLWNFFACCLSLIKGEYERNATLKRLDKQKGVGEMRDSVRILERERRVTEGKGGQVEPAEWYNRTNLPHVLLQDGVCGIEMNLEAGWAVMDISCSAAWQCVDGGWREAGGVMRRTALPLLSFSQIRVNVLEQMQPH